MKVLLKNYVSIVELPAGILFSAGARSFVLKGTGLFSIVRKLLNRLDGNTDIAKINRQIPDKLRLLFGKLLDKLDADDMLQHIPDDKQPEPSDLEQRLYRQTLRFLANETPGYKSYFADWRSQPLLIAGEGVSCAALLRGLAASGAGRLWVHDHGPAKTEVDVDHRLTLAEAIRDSREKGFQFSVKLMDEDALADAVDGGRAPLLYCADDLCGGASGALFERLRALAGPGSMFGGIFHARAFVGPRLDGPGSGWLEAWRRARSDPDPGFPRATLSIIGSLMAFEALKAKLYCRLEGEEKNWDRSHFYAISPLGDISTHATRSPSVEPVHRAVKPGDKGEEEWRLSELSRLEEGMPSAFDPLVGVFSWAADGEENFPLPHRTIRVRIAATPDDLVITQWGITPQDAGLRAIRAAAETYASRAAGDTPPGPVIAAVSDSDWRRQARAHALALNGEWGSRAIIHRADPGGVADPSLQMLLRLARLYSEVMPKICLATVTGSEAAVAGAWIGTQGCIAAGPSPVAAGIEALGGALSAWQRPGAVPNPDRITQAWHDRLAAAATAVELGRLMDPPATAKAGDGGFVTTGHRLYPPLLGSGPLVIGWVSVDPVSR